MQGLSNGNVGIIRTAVAELVPYKELQPRAFSVMPLVWTVGSIFGPSIGGSLVHPVTRFPKIFGKIKFLETYPFALPNLLISSLFLIGIFSGILFLRETLAEKKHQKDYGLMLGSTLTRSCTRRKHPEWHRRNTSDYDEAASPFLRSSTASSSDVNRILGTLDQKPAQDESAWSKVFTYQSSLNLGVYTFCK